MAEDILNTPDDELLREVEEDFGEQQALARKFDRAKRQSRKTNVFSKIPLSTFKDDPIAKKIIRSLADGVKGREELLKMSGLSQTEFESKLQKIALRVSQWIFSSSDERERPVHMKDDTPDLGRGDWVQPSK
jgi:hypothetical protein